MTITPETKKQLQAMQVASDQFYRAAQAIGVHAFIEHAGLMNEHIKMLARLADAGEEIEFVNVHSGAVADKMRPHEGAYLGEKFACIFSPLFTPAGWAAFVKTMEHAVAPHYDAASLRPLIVRAVQQGGLSPRDVEKHFPDVSGLARTTVQDMLDAGELQLNDRLKLVVA